MSENSSLNDCFSFINNKISLCNIEATDLIFYLENNLVVSEDILKQKMYYISNLLDDIQEKIYLYSIDKNL